MDLGAFVRGLPKAELHLHIEGSLEPQLMFKLAKRHSLNLKYASVEALRKAYQFDNLQSFLDIYYEGASAPRRRRPPRAACRCGRCSKASPAPWRRPQRPSA